ncbi:MAG TPA: Maf family protein [Anaerolineae bacterium]|nr:Maf family protein [Anaerolineae bacterium]
MKPLWLASQSPRRREMITWLGVPIQTTSADVDESPFADEPPCEQAVRLAQLKAQTLATTHAAWILAADTIVDLDQTALGKPASSNEAVVMLRQLRNRAHTVHTGVALYTPKNGVCLRRVTTSVQMRAYTDAEIAAYIAGGDPLDKAGAYAIQHSGFAPAVAIDRCYANVVGLPLCAVVALLEEQGLALGLSIPALCLRHFNYRCPAPDRGIRL